MHLKASFVHMLAVEYMYLEYKKNVIEGISLLIVLGITKTRLVYGPIDRIENSCCF